MQIAQVLELVADDHQLLRERVHLLVEAGDLVLQLLHPLAQLLLLAALRAGAGTEQGALALQDPCNVGLIAGAYLQVVGKGGLALPSRSACSRARRALSAVSSLRTMPRLARVVVSSSRTTTSPASTRWPSRTLSAPTTPPVGCCTLRRFELDDDAAGGDDGAVERNIDAPGRSPCRRAAARPGAPRQGSAGRRAPCRSQGASLGCIAATFAIAALGGRPRIWRAFWTVLASTSSFGPNATASPAFMTRIRSTAAMALGRWAMTTPIAPRALSPPIAAPTAASPSASRLALGSSSTTRNGSP